jgi:hypothetical protein
VQPRRARARPDSRRGAGARAGVAIGRRTRSKDTALTQCWSFLVDGGSRVQRLTITNRRYRPILLKNSFALPGRTPHRKVDRSECATSDASEPGKGSTTPRIHSESRAEEFFNGIGRTPTFKLRHDLSPYALRATPKPVSPVTRLERLPVGSPTT